jgi:hypothetical protein
MGILASMGSSTQVPLYSGKKARLIVFIIEPLFVPSFERGFQGEVKEVTAQANLNANTTNDLLVSGARLIFQEEIMLEHREVGVYGKKSLTQMNEDVDLEDGVRVEMD